MRGCKTKALSREAPVTLVPSFLDLLQPLSSVMTAPSFQSFQTLLAGWVLPASAHAHADARRALPASEPQHLWTRDKSRVTECVARVYAAPDRPLKIVTVEPLIG